VHSENIRACSVEWLKKGPKAQSTKQKARIDIDHELRDTEFTHLRGNGVHTLRYTEFKQLLETAYCERRERGVVRRRPARPRCTEGAV
jgi:hypothetical protein